MTISASWGTGEPVPPREVLKILQGTGTGYSGYGWQSPPSGATNFPSSPQFLEANGIGTDSTRDPLRFDLNRWPSVVVARSGSPAMEEEPIGNWNYVNRVYNVELEVYTNKNKLELFNLIREIRRICHKNRQAPTASGFQRMQFINFVPETENAVNIWFGTVSIQFVNFSVPMENNWTA